MAIRESALQRVHRCGRRMVGLPGGDWATAHVLISKSVTRLSPFRPLTPPGMHAGHVRRRFRRQGTM
jgi:hypothetical protein